MKKTLIVFMMVLLAAMLVISCDNKANKPEAKTYKVGDNGPAGGIIFYVADTEQTSNYVDSTGATQTYTWKYLEAAPSDISITEGETTTEAFIFGYDVDWDSTAYIPVCDVSENSVGINGTNAAIGQGRYNTTQIVKVMPPAYKKYSSPTSSDIVENFAAKLCSTYEGGGYNDWFLPSLNELGELYSQYLAGKIKGTWHTTFSESTKEYYWSSSEKDGYNAWTVCFGDNGAVSATSRNADNSYVRPIRAF